MSSLFSSYKSPEEIPAMITFVGENVSVLGHDLSVGRFITDASNPKTHHEGSPSSPLKGQGQRRLSFFERLRLDMGARCPSGQLWRDQLVTTQNFVVLVPYIEPDDEKLAIYFTKFWTKKEIDQLLSFSYKKKKNILLVIQLSEEQQFQNAPDINPIYQEWIDGWKEKHDVTHLTACLQTEHGMEAVLEWVARQTQEVQGKTGGEEKSRSALHWLAELGKKMLVFGAPSKAATAANS